MLIGTKLIILWVGLLASSYGSDSDEGAIGFSAADGAFYTEDAVIINGKHHTIFFNLNYDFR